MKTAKRVATALLAALMAVSCFSFGVLANGKVEDSFWQCFGIKYTQTGTVLDGSETGFTFEANEDGGINVHSPAQTETDGVYAVSALTNTAVTTLDNLAVEIVPGETFTAQLDRYGHGSSISVMFSTAPITDISGIGNSALAYTGGLRSLMPTDAKSIAASVTNSYNKYTGKVLSDVAIIYFDGKTLDKNYDKGYKWLFSGRNNKTQGSVEDASGISKEYLRVDISEGIVFEFVPDTTLGYKVKVNGTEYSSGKNVGFFPDVEGDAMTKAKADIDLSALADEEGYLTVGAVAAEQEALDYTVETVNGVPAANWAGEAPASHSHNFIENKTKSTCLEDGRKLYTCSCGQHFVFENEPATGHIWATRFIEDWTDWTYTTTDRHWVHGAKDEKYYFYAFVDYPTCTENGCNHKMCTQCGACEDVTLPKFNHQAIYTREGDKQNDNLKVYTASRWGDWVITTPATDTTPGIKTRTCFLCGGTQTMEYTKWDDSEDILDQWYVSGETTISRSNGFTSGNIIPTAVKEDGKRVKTTVNDDGSITLLDEAAQTGVINSSTTYNNITKITNKTPSHLNGYSATVQMIPVKNDDGVGMYADNLNFYWTNEYDHYCYAAQMVSGTFSKTINTPLEDSRMGYLWNYYVSGEEYSFGVTLMDGVVLWNTYTFGTPNDNVYDVAFYTSVCRGEMWAIMYSETGYDLENDYTSTEIHLDPEQPITVEAGYGYDEDEGVPDSLSFTVNGLLVYCTGLGASQSYDPIYHLSIAAYAADSGRRPAAFTLLDVCGEKPTEFDGYTDPNACDHDWSEYELDTKIIKRDGKNQKAPKEATCHEKGVLISTCANCEGTRRIDLKRTEHQWGDMHTVSEPTCTTPGLKYHVCGLVYKTDDDQEAWCQEFEYFRIPATGHVWGDWTVTKDATCTEEGSKMRTCAVCNECEVEPIQAAGHDWNDWTVTKEATETEKGLKERTCKNCDAKETEEIPTLESAVLDNPFIDIPEKSWYTAACLWCNNKGYMTGTTKTTFAPSQELTRAQFVQILAKVEGVDLSKITYRAAFKDVPAGKWYTNAIIWAVDFGVTGGIGSGKFGPDQKVTRAQLASFLRTYAEKKGKDVSGRTDITGYDDYAQVANWAKDPMSWAVNAGLISSTSTTSKLLAPTTVATRAQAALIIKNLCDNILK